MKEQIESILTRVVPNAYWCVSQSKSPFTGGEEIKIVIAASSENINNVKGQHPACVSLWLRLKSMELDTQIFGGNGGGCIYRNPRKEDPKERYLALKGVKVPFRKPKKESKFVLAAIERFAAAWKETVRANLSEMPSPYDYEAALK